MGSAFNGKQSPDARKNQKHNWKKEAEREILSHIEDSKDEYLDRGYTDLEAARLAKEHFGNEAEIWNQLSMLHRYDRFSERKLLAWYGGALWFFLAYILVAVATGRAIDFLAFINLSPLVPVLAALLLITEIFIFPFVWFYIIACFCSFLGLALVLRDERKAQLHLSITLIFLWLSLFFSYQAGAHMEAYGGFPLRVFTYHAHQANNELWHVFHFFSPQVWYKFYFNMAFWLLLSFCAAKPIDAMTRRMRSALTITAGLISCFGAAYLGLLYYY